MGLFYLSNLPSSVRRGVLYQCIAKKFLKDGKRSKKASKYEAFKYKEIDIFDFDEPVEPNRIQETERKTEERRDVMRTTKFAKIPEARSLEITRSGNVRSEKEIESIMKKKVEHRQKKKKEKFLAYSKKDKERTVTRRILRNRAFEDGVTNRPPSQEGVEEKSIPVKSEPKMKTVLVDSLGRVKYTKEQRAAFRKMATRRKAQKKLAKKIRQGKATQEEEIVPESDYFPVEDIFSHYESFVGKMKFAITPKHVSAVLMTIQLFHSTSFTMDLTIVANLFVDEGLNMQVFFKTSGVLALLRALRSALSYNRAESMSDKLSDFSYYGKMIMSSKAVEALLVLLCVLISMKFFTKDTGMRLRKFVKSEIIGKVKDCSYLEVFELAMGSVTTIIRSAELIWNGLPVSSLLLQPDPVVATSFQAKRWLRDKTCVSHGLPKVGSVDIRQYLIEGKEIYEALSAIKDKVNVYTVSGDEVLDLYTKVRDVYNYFNGMYEGHERITPFGVIVEGPPGVGKSKVLDLICKVHCQMMEREYSPSLVYHRVTTSPFWDGYDITTPIVHYSELGSKPRSFVQMRGDSVIDEITSVIDSQPLALNMSAVEDKGKVFCTAELVIADTNCADLNLDTITRNPAAYRRRFVYVEPTVKHQYRKDNSQAIETGKCDDGTNFYSKWLFKVYRFVPVDNKNSRMEVLCDKYEYEDFARLMINLMKDHVTYENAAREKGKQESALQKLSEDSKGEEKKSEDIASEAWYSWGEQSPSPPGKKTESFFDIKQFLFLSRLAILSVDVSIAVLVLVVAATKFFLACMELKRAIWAYVRILLLLVLLVKINNPLWIALVCMTIYIGEERMLVSKYSFSSAKKAMNRATATMKFRANNFFAFCGISDKKLRLFISSLAATTAGVILVSKLIKYFTKEVNQFEASALPSSDTSRIVNDFEEKTECGKSYERILVKGTNCWNIKELVPSVHTGDLDTLYQRVMRNVRSASLIGIKGHTVKTKVLGVCGSYAVLNKHAINAVLQKNGGVHFKIAVAVNRVQDDVTRCTVIYPEHVVDVVSDVVMIKLEAINFVDVVKHFPLAAETFTSARGVVNDKRLLVASHPVSITVKDGNEKYILGPVVAYNYEGHAVGMCGFPVVAQRDSGCCIVGMHSAGSVGNAKAWAAVITRPQVEEAVCKIVQAVQRPLTLSESDIFPHGQVTHHKSPFRYEMLEYVDYFGSDGRIIMTHQKSRLIKSSFSEHIPLLFAELGLERKKEYFPPLMQPKGAGQKFVSPYNLGLQKLNKDRRALDPRVMNKVLERLQKHLFGFFDELDLNLKPLDLQTAVNGVSFDPYIRRISLSAGAGYGTPGKKSEYFIREEKEDGTFVDHPSEDVQKLLVELVAAYNRGEGGAVVYKAQLKDEPRLREKVEAGNTRVFYASPLAYYLLTRMFLGPFYSLMFEFKEVFKTAIGIDMHRDTEKLYSMFSSRFEHFIEGDYGGYDTSMPFAIGEAANTVVYSFLSRYGYNDHALEVVSGILSDNLFFLVNILGEMVRVPGFQPSGKGYTAEDNSLRNIICLMYFWYSHDELCKKDFFEHVDPVTYGDDVLVGVSNYAANLMNGVTYAEFVSRVLGMEFTTSDKGQVEKPFVDLENTTFLKRTRRFSTLLGRLVSPLEVDSIYKALQWSMPSKVVNALMQDISTMNSCIREMIFHLDDLAKLEFARESLCECLSRYHQVPLGEILTLCPPIREVVSQLCSGNMPVTEGRQETQEEDVVFESQSVSTESTELELYTQTFASIPRAFGRARGLIQRPTEEMIKELNVIKMEFEKLGHPCPGYTFHQIRRTGIYGTNIEFRGAVNHYFRMRDKIRALTSSIERIESMCESKAVFESDMGEMSSGKIGSETKENIENVQDVSGEATKVIATTARSIDVSDGGFYSMDRFVERPITVATLSLADAADLTYSVDPWSAFFSEPSVRAKIRNFAYFKGTLVLKITTSATPFHYGRIQVSYKALMEANARKASLETDLLTANRFASLTYLSQSPQVLEINVCDNEPVEMRIPFICPAGMARLFNKSALILPAATDYDDISSLGVLYINSLVAPRSASPAYTPVSMFIYAWLEDATFSGTTGTVCDIVSESKVDERRTGPVQKFASNAALVSGSLTNVPVIGPFAQASKMAFDAAAGISALFGFSKPTMEDGFRRVKNDCYQNGALTIGYDSGKKIVLDPLQEVTVDGSDCGSNTDEMVIQHLASRRSLLGVFDWETTDVPQSAPIFEAPVTPTFCQKTLQGLGPAYLIHRTSLCAAAAPFRFWRGSITYTFVAVCSKYHRGKIAIKFDPNIAQAVVIDTVVDLNKQSQLLWDLQETQMVQVCVNWAFPKPWCRVLDPLDSTDFAGIGLLGPTLVEMCNGYISVTPVTRLQSPDDSSIKILMYVHSDDLMVNVHDGLYAPIEYATPESDYGDEVTCVDLNPPNHNVGDISKVHFGELPVSFRALGKRYVTQKNLELGSAGVNPYLEILQVNYPIVDPPMGGGTQIFPGVTHIYNYLRPMYLGIRGGMKFRYIFEGLNFRVGSLIRVKLERLSDDQSELFKMGVVSTRSDATPMGGVIFIPSTNAGIEFEVPVYTNNKFGISFSQDPFPSTLSTIEPFLGRKHAVRSLCDSEAGARAVVDIAFGDDFSLFRFEGAPPYLAS